MRAQPSIDAVRIARRIDHLASLTVEDRPYERTAFSDLHRTARGWLADQMRSVGLDVVVDAGGNLIGTLLGCSSEHRAIVVGSHSDTVPLGGRFDGVAGLVVAMEIAECLKEAAYALHHPFQVVDFLAEEPNRYGLSCIGSRAMAGKLPAEMLGYREQAGSTLADGIRQMGGDPGMLTGPLCSSRDIAAFLELHIEQGRVLEAADDDIGIVTGIAGIARIEVAVSGFADHAGTTPMALRRDALAGAAEMVLAIENRATAGVYGALVATVGKLDVSPNAANAVPGHVDLVVEMRGQDGAALAAFRAWAEAEVSRVAAARDLTATIRLLSSSDPVPLDACVQRVVADAAAEAGLRARAMPSGAGHDAAWMAGVAPAGMIFVPCLKGRSHCPEEFATTEQIAKGAQVMLGAVLSLDETLDQIEK